MAFFPVPNKQIDYNNFHDAGYQAQFGWQHNGDDIASAIGTPYYAPISGVAHRGGSGWGGNFMVILDGDDGHTHYFAHCNSSIVSDGQRVKEGQQLGTTGAQGSYVTGPHLHWGICSKEFHAGGLQCALADGGDINPHVWLTQKGHTGHATAPTTQHFHSQVAGASMINLTPWYISLFNGRDLVERFDIQGGTLSSKGWDINETYYAQTSGTFDTVVVHDKYGHHIARKTVSSTKLAYGKPLNFNLTVELDNTTDRYSLVTDDFKTKYWANRNDLNKLDDLVKKNAGWTKNGDRLSGNVKTSGNQLKHNDDMNTISVHNESHEDYEPALFSKTT